MVHYCDADGGVDADADDDDDRDVMSQYMACLCHSLPT